MLATKFMYLQLIRVITRADNSLEKVAASSLSSLSSFRSFIIVSDTILFSVSYLDLRLASATCG